MTVWPMICALLLIACGLLAAMDIVVKKLAQAEQAIAKLLPYQGWIGLTSCALGLWNFIWSLVSLRHAKYFSGGAWFWWISWLLGGLVLTGIGLLLGFPLIRKLMGGKPATAPVAGEAPAPAAEAPEEAPGEEAIAEQAPAVEAPAEPAPAPVVGGTGEAGEALYQKLQAFRTPLGLASIALGVWLFVACLIWTPPSFVFMGIVLSLGLLAGGALAAAGFLAAKRPDAKAALDKLGACQDKIGLGLLVFSTICLLYTLFTVGTISRFSKAMKYSASMARKIYGSTSGGVWVYWVFMLLASLMGVALGFLLGWPLLKKCLGRPDDEGEDLRAKLTKLQIPLGLAGLALGLWNFICVLIWAPMYPSM